MEVEREYEELKIESDVDHFKLLTIYIGKHRKLFWIIVFLMFINVIFSITAPLILNYVIEIIEIDNEELLNQLNLNGALLGFGVVAFLAWFFTSVQFHYVAALTARFVRDLRIDAYSNLIKNKIPFFDDQKSGDLTSRIINDTNELSEAGDSIAWVFTSIVRVLFVSIIFVIYSFEIALVAIGFIPIIFLLAYIVGNYERKVSKIWREKFGEVNSRFQEIMSKIQISKAFNREKENLKKFQIINEETYQASVKRGLAIFIFWPMTDLMKHGLMIAILWIGTLQVAEGLPVATVILFLILINYYYWPLITIASNFQDFQGAMASLERISMISFDSNLHEDVNGNNSMPKEISKIKFENVNFSYDENNEILKNINFEVNKGERVALVGHTGAGKTTIGSLLMRFYSIKQGKISINGTNINDINLLEYRERVSLVSQKVLLFKGTIRENLILSDKTINDEKIWEILESVQAAEFIELLPNKLDYVVSENGKNLSSGQKQMISLARALISKPEFIILDEASSAVDIYTEAKITKGIDAILSNSTSVSIAHRLTTIMKSDKIIVMEDGLIKEIGSHDDLIKINGIYSEMYNLYLSTQSAKFLEKIKY